MREAMESAGCVALLELHAKYSDAFESACLVSSWLLDNYIPFLSCQWGAQPKSTCRGRSLGSAVFSQFVCDINSCWDDTHARIPSRRSAR